MPIQSIHPPSPQNSIQRLLVHLVLRDAMRPVVLGSGIVVVIQAFISRYIPPSVIRGSIQEASASSRAVFLVVILCLYAWAMRPVLRTALASPRLRYFRHLPIPQTTWLFTHLWLLFLLNLPWMGVAAYGLFTGSHGPSLPSAMMWWLAWLALTLALQLTAFWATLRNTKGLVLPFWGALPFGLYFAFCYASTIVAVGVLGFAIGLILYWLRQPMPVASAKTWRLFSFLRGPLWGLFRLELLTLLRKGLRPVWIALLLQVLFVGLLGLGLLNFQRLELGQLVMSAESSLFSVVQALLFPSTLAGAFIAVVSQRLRAPYLWWEEHLGVTGAQILTSRLILGWLGTLPSALLFPLVLLLFGVKVSFLWLCVIVGAAIAIGLWSAVVVVLSGLEAQRDYRLFDALTWVLAVRMFVPILWVSMLPTWSWVILLSIPYLIYRCSRVLLSVRQETRSMPTIQENL